MVFVVYAHHLPHFIVVVGGAQCQCHVSHGPAQIHLDAGVQHLPSSGSHHHHVDAQWAAVHTPAHLSSQQAEPLLHVVDEFWLQHPLQNAALGVLGGQQVTGVGSVLRVK